MGGSGGGWALPRGSSTSTAISCPTIATCFAAGDTVTGGDGSSDAVVVTTDAGARCARGGGASGAVGHSAERHLLSERLELLGGRGLGPFGDDRRRAQLAAARLGLGRFAELSEPAALRRDGRQRRRGLGARGNRPSIPLRHRFTAGAGAGLERGLSVAHSVPRGRIDGRGAVATRRHSSLATEVATGRRCPFPPWSPRRPASRRRPPTSRGHSRSVIRRPTARSPVRPPIRCVVLGSGSDTEVAITG